MRRSMGPLSFLILIIVHILGLHAEETAVYYNLAAEKCDIILGTREEFDMMERFEHNPENNDQYHGCANGSTTQRKLSLLSMARKAPSLIRKDGVGHRAKSFPAKVVKTFGAGDSYAAGFIYGIHARLDD